MMLAFSVVCFVLTSAHGMPINDPSTFTNFGLLSGQKDNLILGFQKQLSDVQESKRYSLAASLRTFGREEAAEEVETKLSQFDSLYTNLQKKTNEIVTRKSIVDTISEHEKYGNDGGKSRAVSIAIVGAYENLANFVNAVFEVPAQTMNNVKLKASEILRYAGKQLVGL